MYLFEKYKQRELNRIVRYILDAYMWIDDTLQSPSFKTSVLPMPHVVSKCNLGIPRPQTAHELVVKSKKTDKNCVHTKRNWIITAH